jgi:Amt family ammonium transporter
MAADRQVRLTASSEYVLLMVRKPTLLVHCLNMDEQTAVHTVHRMITTLRMHVRNKDSRSFFRQYLSGKLLGLVAVIALVYLTLWFIGTSAGASMLHADAPALKGDDIVNPLNTAWVCITAFLVFFMQAGFMMLEGGFARTRETSNVMMECIFDTALCGMLFYAFGFAFMFGEGNGWIGYHYFFLQGVPATYGATGIGFMAFFLFQFAFADTASTIVSGAMVGRTDFKGDIIYSFFVSGLIYPIFGHWIWGPNGVLATGDFLGMDGTPMRDFAGSTVVHTVGGVLALCGAIALGPRLGRKFKRDGGGMPPGHNMTLAALGAVILWFGWYGFNPGSTLSAMDFEGIGRVATNTTLAACAGALVAVLWVFPRAKKWDVGISINGLLAGLVAITAPCYWVSPTGSIAIGAIAGFIMIMAVDFTEWIRVDDPCGAFAVHGACGIFGTISIGLFATGDYGNPAFGAKGLFYGGGTDQLVSQIIGSAFVTVCVLAVGLLVMFGIKAIGVLRISEAGELAGLDITEHGAPAYHPEPSYDGYSPLASGVGAASPASAGVPSSS